MGKKVDAPSSVTPKRAEQAEPGEAVVDGEGRLITKYKTEYSKNNLEKCVVSGCNEPMHDSKRRRTGAKGACRAHYMKWIRARSKAIENGEPVPPPPNAGA